VPTVVLNVGNRIRPRINSVLPFSPGAGSFSAIMRQTGEALFEMAALPFALQLRILSAAPALRGNTKSAVMSSIFHPAARAFLNRRFAAHCTQ
jgi:hypothetical protein